MSDVSVSVSEAVELEPEPQAVKQGPAPGSLEDRIAKRREALEQKTTEKFDVPGYEGLMQVELRLLGGKRQYAIVEALDRIHDDYKKAITAAGDLLVAATVGFYMVDGDGNAKEASGMTWQRAAEAADKTFEAHGEGATRVAMIRLIGETGVIELAGEWRLWFKTRGAKVDRDLERDS